MWNYIGGFTLFACIYLSLMLGFMAGSKSGHEWGPDYEMCQNFCGGKLAGTDMDRTWLGLGETVCTCKADGSQLRY
jgi:hypothetical protein